MSALAYAAYTSNRPRLVSLLSVPGVNAHTRDFYGRSLLWWAATGIIAKYRYHHHEGQAILDLLLDKYHLDPSFTDRFGRTPLGMALLKDRKGAISFLSTRGWGHTHQRQTLSKIEPGSTLCHMCMLRNPPGWKCEMCVGTTFKICSGYVSKGAGCPGAHALMEIQPGEDGDEQSSLQSTASLQMHQEENE
jgi:hypothetical protein